MENKFNESIIDEITTTQIPTNAIDFTSWKRIFRPYGGSDRKIPVTNGDKTYMLKFSDKHEKKGATSTSYVNNAVSEYISSHIFESVDIPVHKTVLGIYKDTLVVGCLDFRDSGDNNMEFSELMHSIYNSSDLKRIPLLSQIYETLYSRDNNLSDEIINESVERYWDTFVVDSLVGNFDRHMGNWGYITNNDTVVKLAPVYDNASTLLPRISEEGAVDKGSNLFEMLKRCLIFPSPALCLTKEKVGKIGYYDMLSSGYDENCTKSLLKIFPKFNLATIENIIDNTPFITDTGKAFYKMLVNMRYVSILKPAYELACQKQIDADALFRLKSGKQFSDEDLKKFIKKNKEKPVIQCCQMLVDDFIKVVKEDLNLDNNYSELKKTSFKVDFDIKSDPKTDK